MRQRKCFELLKSRLSVNPAVVLVGPRQSGKTTLSKMLGERYFDLELEEEQTRLDVLWNELTGDDKHELIIIDEAQAMPRIFPRLRAAIDAHRQQNGRFLILGSVAPAIMREVADLLTGRVSIVELAPFGYDELLDRPLRECWFYGGYPNGGIDDQSMYPQWHIDYLRVLIERDLPTWGLPAKPQMTFRLIKMLAALHGQQQNASSLASSLGLSHPTVESYLEYLEGAFIIRRLLPFFSNMKKRLVKRPKLYIRDTGLLHSILQIKNSDTLLSTPWAGASWEGFVIEQIVQVTSRLRFVPNITYFRTSDGYELDLVLESGSKRLGIEVKLTSAPAPADVARLQKVGAMAGTTQNILISKVLKSEFSKELVSCNLKDLLAELPDLLS